MKPAAEPTANDDLMSRLVERIDRLQMELDNLNVALERHLERIKRRRKSAKASPASFTRRAKNLADRAPS